MQDAAERALTASLQIFDEDGSGKPLMSEAERRDLIAPTTTGPKRARLQYSIKHEIKSPPFRRGAQFVVEHWDGIQVVHDRARVYVSGHGSYTPTSASPQKRDGTWQYQLLHVRAGQRWLVSEERAASNDQG